MGKVIAISNQKGGVGKSATANALYGALKRKGYKVLMLDADPQCNTTDAFKAIIENQETLYDVMKKECTFRKAIQQTETGDIVAGDPLLSRASDNFNEIGREHRIAEPIEEIKNLYDFIIIDTVPSLGIMLINSITACDGIIIPTTADRDSLQGMNDLQETIYATKKYANSNLEIYGLLVTQYRKTNLGQILMGMIIDNFGLFHSPKKTITTIRVIGAILVVLGVLLISLAKEIKSDTIKIEAQEIETIAIKETNPSPVYNLWLWRIFGVCIGMTSAIQIGINGQVGKIVGSPIKGALFSFGMGAITLLLINLVIILKSRTGTVHSKIKEKYPWWIWIGGTFGAISVQLNVFLSGKIGTGLTVTLIVVGVTIGGLLVDTFGLFGATKKSINKMTIIGIIVMLLGAVAIKLL